MRTEIKPCWLRHSDATENTNNQHVSHSTVTAALHGPANKNLLGFWHSKSWCDAAEVLCMKQTPVLLCSGKHRVLCMAIRQDILIYTFMAFYFFHWSHLYCLLMCLEPKIIMHSMYKCSKYFKMTFLCFWWSNLCILFVNTCTKCFICFKWVIWCSMANKTQMETNGKL